MRVVTLESTIVLTEREEHELAGSGAHTYNSELRRGTLEDQKFKVILGYVVSSKPA